MTNIYLDKDYSTTKMLTMEKQEIVNKSEDKFETILFLPEGENRKGEGGLRTKDYFKKSYEDKPLISIITVVYNGEKYLEETIQSVINQTYDNVEYIIIDGGSTDGTLDIIKKYEDRIDYWVSERDKGIYDAMNKGISLCGGKVVGIINADDYYELDTFKTLCDSYLKTDKITILHGNMNIIKDEKIFYVSRPNNKLAILKKGMILNHPTVFVPTEIYKTSGLFSTDYKIASDWELMLKFYLNDICFINIDLALANFRLGGASYLIDKQVIREKHAIRIKNKVFKIFDKYYFYDLVKFYIFGSFVSKISLLKQSILSKI